jgi:hypothetical protein
VTVTYVRVPRLLESPGSRLEVVCSDIDSTLADTRQRRFACPTVDNTRTWQEYAMLCSADAPIPGSIRLLRMFHAAGYGIHLITNRPECARRLTVGWLSKHGVPYDELRMRPTDTALGGDDFKTGYIMTLRMLGFDPLLFLEDWPATAAAIEAEGVPVLCVNPRYADGHPPAKGPSKGAA